MPDLTAKRTLVKSPPELWEELSEVERLAKHLGAFGEITITKLEPEHTVAWEGEHASGTVSIEPSGWGTKVTLWAELPEREEPEVTEPEPVAEAEPAEPEPEPAQESEPVSQPEPQPEPVAELPEPDPAADAQPASKTPRRGFWAWLFRPRRAEQEPAEEETAAQPEPEPEPELVAEQPPPAEPVSEEAEVLIEEPDEPEPVAEEPELEIDANTDDDPGLDPERARVILDEALDTLGAAHHRPFSRG